MSISIEDPEEEPRSENLEASIYYDHLSVTKDIDIKDLLNVIRQKEAHESVGFMKEYKVL